MSKMSQPIQRPGRPSCFFFFLMGTKKNPTNLVEGVKIMLPVKFRWILFGCFREEVENVSANQRSGQPSCFSDRREKHKLSKRRIKSCFLSSFVEFRSAIAENRKCLSQSEASAAILIFRTARKNTNFVEDIEILLPAITHAKVGQMRQKSKLYYIYTKTNFYTKFQVNIWKDDWEMSENWVNGHRVDKRMDWQTEWNLKPPPPPPIVSPVGDTHI